VAGLGGRLGPVGRMSPRDGSPACCEGLEGAGVTGMWLWGFNGAGQCGSGLLGEKPGGDGGGRGRADEAPWPVKGGGGRAVGVTVESVSCGWDHTMFTAGGRVYAVGSNEFGQVGDGTEVKREAPRRVAYLGSGGVSVVAIACGAHSSAAIVAAPRGGRRLLFTWGRYQHSNAPAAMHGRDEVLEAAPGFDLAALPERNVCGQLPAGASVAAVACGMAHMVCCTAEGLVYAWGYNDAGQLGTGSVEDWQVPVRQVQAFVPTIGFLVSVEPGQQNPRVQIKTLACGNNFTVMVDTKGRVFTAGQADAGQLGHLTQASRRLDGTRVAPGDAGAPGGAGGGRALCESVPRQVAGLEGHHVVQVACGGRHTLARTDSGAVFTWGDHAEGALGGGPPSAEPHPGFQGGGESGGATPWSVILRRAPSMVFPKGAMHVAAGQLHSLVATSLGQLWGWGYNGYGQVGGSLGRCVWAPHVVEDVSGVEGASAGAGHTAILTRPQTLRVLCERVVQESVTELNAAELGEFAEAYDLDDLKATCERTLLRKFLREGC